jgi:hypothetical protein
LFLISVREQGIFMQHNNILTYNKFDICILNMKSRKHKIWRTDWIHFNPVHKCDFKFWKQKLILHHIGIDGLCGVVVRVPGYRSRGLGLIPGATRFSEK